MLNWVGNDRPMKMRVTSRAIDKKLSDNNYLGSGTGKSRFVVKPNLLQANCSYVVTDPKGELLQTQAYHLEQKGYKIKVFDLTDMSKSSHYNPFHYIRDENGVITMVKCLMDNTRGQGEKDDFWTSMATNVITSLCFFCIERLPEEERNFGTVMKLFKLETVDENDPSYKSLLNEMMDDLAAENPNSMAVKFYTDYKKSSGRTAQSILSTVASRLQYFNFKSVVELTSDDTLELEKLGDEKQALFVVIPPADGPFNFLVSMMYSQLFETLFFHASHNCKGQRLPVHVRFLLDEFANVGTIPEFDKKLSVMRSFEISCTIILQSLSQLKKMYEKEWEVIVDNCDSFLFLGCQGKTTLEYVSQKLGKATISSNDSSRTYGSKGSSSTSRKRIGRELMTVDELQKMPDNNCILFIRGLNPFYCTKFKLENHKNFQYTPDAHENDGQYEKYVYIYDPFKYGAQPTKPVESTEVLDEALNGRDVNADRIAREHRLADVVNSDGPDVSNNGLIMGQFKSMEETFSEFQNSAEPINLTFDTVYDRDYEFRTSKPFMLDLESLNLEDEDNGQMVIDEPYIYDADEPNFDGDGFDE